MILPVIRLNLFALIPMGYEASLYSITTLFPMAIPHKAWESGMVSTSIQALPSELIPNTLITTDVNYFELTINYKKYIRIYWYLNKNIYLLIVRSW
jgi:hypothetical protein